MAVHTIFLQLGAAVPDDIFGLVFLALATPSVTLISLLSRRYEASSAGHGMIPTTLPAPFGLTALYWRFPGDAP